jgi:hypothetical protein
LFDTVVYEKRRRLAHSLKEELNVNHYFVSFDPYLNSMLPLHAAIPNKDLLPPVSKFDYSRFSQLAALGKVKFWVFPAQNKTTAFLGVNLQEYTQEVVEDGLLVLRP